MTQGTSRGARQANGSCLATGLGPASFGEPVHPGTAPPLRTHDSQVTGPGEQVTPSPDTPVFPGWVFT